MSVNVLSTKVLIEDMIFTSLRLLEMGPPPHVVIRATQRSSCLQGKVCSIFILRYSKTLSIGLGNRTRNFPVCGQARRLQNGSFFLKISKGIGKALGKTLSRAKLASLKSPTSVSGERLFSASFQTFCLTAHAYLNTQKNRLFCSLSSAPPTELILPWWKNFLKRFLIKVLVSSSLAQKDGNKWWAIATKDGLFALYVLHLIAANTIQNQTFLRRKST